VNRILDCILDIVFPENIYCICCGDMIAKSRIHGLCDDCIKSIDWVTEDLFDEKKGFSFDGVLSLANYDFRIQQIMHGLKFHGKNYYASSMGLLMGELFNENCKGEYVFVPVPMHREKEEIRGYNQAALLAKYASKTAGAQFIKDALLKIKTTESMRIAGGEKRRNLLEGSIACNPKCLNVIKGADIVLVDDVVTTGSTAEECSRVLKKAGAKSVTVLSFAVAGKRKQP